MHCICKGNKLGTEGTAFNSKDKVEPDRTAERKDLQQKASEIWTLWKIERLEPIRISVQKSQRNKTIEWITGDPDFKGTFGQLLFGRQTV